MSLVVWLSGSVFALINAVALCLLLLLLFWHAPLGVRIVKRRHQSPEWTILSHANFFVHGEVFGFQVLLDSLHPRSTRASWWSPPVLHKEQLLRSCWYLFLYVGPGGGYHGGSPTAVQAWQPCPLWEPSPSHPI